MTEMLTVHTLIKLLWKNVADLMNISDFWFLTDIPICKSTWLPANVSKNCLMAVLISADPDQMQHFAASYPGLLFDHACLSKYLG